MSWVRPSHAEMYEGMITQASHCLGAPLPSALPQRSGGRGELHRYTQISVGGFNEKVKNSKQTISFSSYSEADTNDLSHVRDMGKHIYHLFLAAQSWVWGFGIFSLKITRVVLRSSPENLKSIRKVACAEEWPLHATISFLPRLQICNAKTGVSSLPYWSVVTKHYLLSDIISNICPPDSFTSKHCEGSSFISFLVQTYFP